jgi:hypothetical protein
MLIVNGLLQLLLDFINDFRSKAIGKIMYK